MPTVKCPKCATLLKLQPQPKAVRVKCPKCATVLQVAASPAATPNAAAQSPAAQSPAAQQPAAQQPVPTQPAAPIANSAAPTQPAGANDPFAGLPTPGATPAAAANPFDFADMNMGAGPAPSGAADPFAAAGAPDPFAAAGAPDPFAAGANPAPYGAAGGAAGGFPAGNFAAAAPALGASPPASSSGDATGGTPAKSSKKTALIIGIGVGVLVLLMMVGGGIMVALSSSSGGSSATASKSSGPPVDVPEGYRMISIAGHSAAAPPGSDFAPPPTEATATAVQSDKTGAVFYIGEGEYIRANATDREVMYRVGRYMMADVYGSDAIDLGGIGGLQGRSSRGIVLPDMDVQFFHVGDKVVIFACGLERPMAPVSKRPTEQEVEAYDEAMKKYNETLPLVEPEKAAFFESARL